MAAANPKPRLASMLTQPKALGPSPLDKVKAYGMRVIPGNHPGMLAPGNINLDKRPNVPSGAGSMHSSVLSTSFTDEKGRHVLVPRVVGNKILDPIPAWQHYKTTRQHLGIFKTSAHSDAYAEKLHRQQATRATTSQR